MGFANERSDGGSAAKTTKSQDRPLLTRAKKTTPRGACGAQSNLLCSTQIRCLNGRRISLNPRVFTPLRHEAAENLSHHVTALRAGHSEGCNVLSGPMLRKREDLTAGPILQLRLGGDRREHAEDPLPERPYGLLPHRRGQPRRGISFTPQRSAVSAGALDADTRRQISSKRRSPLASSRSLNFSIPLPPFSPVPVYACTCKAVKTVR